MKHIEVNECYALYLKFQEYTEKAEPYEFPLLALIDVNMQKTLEDYEENGVDSQENANAMFRVVLKAIGEDYSEYEVEK